MKLAILNYYNTTDTNSYPHCVTLIQIIFLNFDFAHPLTPSPLSHFELVWNWEQCATPTTNFPNSQGTPCMFGKFVICNGHDQNLNCLKLHSQETNGLIRHKCFTGKAIKKIHVDNETLPIIKLRIQDQAECDNKPTRTNKI